MFEYLDIIDFEQFGYPDLNRYLINMLSSEASNFDNVLWSIVFGNQHIEDIDMGYGIHQIVKTDGHFFLIPFLIQMLSSDEIDKDYFTLILQLLRYMASYAHFKDIDETVEPKVLQIHAMVWSGFAIYLELLKSRSDLQLVILGLLAEYPQFSLQLHSIFVNTIESLTDDSLKASAILQIQGMYLYKDFFPDEYINYLMQFNNQLNPKQLLQTVSLCIMEIQKSDSPGWVISHVTDVYVNWVNRDGKLPKGFWKIHDLKDYILS